jgi:MFS family permease
VLAAASAAGVLAPSMELLVAARVLQGVAGGGILAAGLGSIGRTFASGPARTHATAIWGAAVGAGVTVGPLAAAGLGQAVGWRSAFWVEAGAAAALMTAATTLIESRTTATERRSLDLPGIATLGAAMALLTAALVETRHGWFATTTLVLLGTATLMLGAFAMAELRSRRPMLDPQLLAQPQFLASISGALLTGLAVVGLMRYAPALMQQALHTSVFGSAAVLAAWSATSMVIRHPQRRDHLERHVLPACSLDPARRPVPARVRVHQHQQGHHRRLIRRTAVTIGSVSGVESIQIHLRHRPQHRPRQTILRQPINQRRRHQQHLTAITRKKALSHPRIFII